MPSQTSLLGAAGEHYVMSELLRRGYIAALAPQGVPNADIIVCDVEGTRLCSIQVKTRRERGRDGGWHMKDKHEKLRSDTLFYCFVDFGTGVSAPVVYVVPSPHVAEALERSHRTWLSTPGKKGQEHKDSQIRRLLPDYSRQLGATGHPYGKGWLNPYRDAWQLLKLEAAEPEATDAEQNDDDAAA